MTTFFCNPEEPGDSSPEALRKRALESLLEYQIPMSEIDAALAATREQEPYVEVMIEPEQVKRIANRHLHGELTADQVIEWAYTVLHAHSFDFSWPVLDVLRWMANCNDFTSVDCGHPDPCEWIGHLDLPPDERTNTLRIYSSTLPA